MPNERIPSLRSMQTFCMAARHMSFKAAAAAMFISPSAVSHQVRELERQLGSRLFERGVRELRLSAAGQALFDEIDPLLRGLEHAARRAGSRTERRSVRLLLLPFFASELVIPRLPRFVLAQNDFDLRIETRSDRLDEHAMEADVSVLLRRDPPAGLTVHRLLETRLVPAGAPSVVTQLSSLTAAELVSNEVTLIVQRSRPHAWAEWFASAGIATAPSRKLIELDTMGTVVAAAERGLGIALVPLPLVDARLRRGSLVRLCAVELTTRDTYYLVHREEDERRPEVRELRDWLLAEFRHDG